MGKLIHAGLPAAARPDRLLPILLLLATVAGSAPVGEPPSVRFGRLKQYGAGAGTSSVDAADFDGDGRPDIVVCNRVTSDVSVFINRGGGSFAPGVSYPTGKEPRYVVAGDFDGDAAPDLATVNAKSRTVSVLLNRGAVFERHAEVAAFDPSWLAAADVDGDGDLDILVTRLDETAGDPAAAPAFLAVLRNDGAANFVEDGAFPIGAWPRGGAVGDFDGDGDLDAAIANNRSDDLSIALNDGRGRFDTATRIPTGRTPRYLTAADLDRDGDLDLAVVHRAASDLWIFENDGKGGYAPSVVGYPVSENPHSVAHGDLDRDGDEDIVVSTVGAKDIDLILNDGAGGFTTERLATTRCAAHVVLADLDGDGDPDLMHAVCAGAVAVFSNVTPPRSASSATAAGRGADAR